MIRPVINDNGRSVYGFTGRGLIVAAVCVGILLGGALMAPFAFFRVNHLIDENCAASRTAAKIQQAEAMQRQASNRALLPRINIPGISHQQLIALTLHQERELEHRVVVLEEIARRTCGG